MWGPSGERASSAWLLRESGSWPRPEKIVSICFVALNAHLTHMVLPAAYFMEPWKPISSGAIGACTQRGLFLDPTPELHLRSSQPWIHSSTASWFEQPGVSTSEPPHAL